MVTTTATELDDLLSEAAHTAWRAFRHAVGTMTDDERRRTVGAGADGTETFLLDVVVEDRVLDLLERRGVNVLSEEVGWIDRGSAVTVVLDPIDGTANAAAGVPISAFAATAVVDDEIVSARVLWFETGREWSAIRGLVSSRRTTDRQRLEGASLSMLRPRPETAPAWFELAQRASRVRVLGSSVVEAALVADGAIDLFCDPGGDVHRIVDIAATKLIVEQAGGCVIDARGRDFTFEPDLRLRWSGVFASTRELADEVVAVIAS